MTKKIGLRSLFTILCISYVGHVQMVRAEDAALRINGDLMIHPDQVANIFSLATQQISSSSSWNWPSFQFTTPYKTQWTNVQAQGPFQIQFDTANLNNQELGFTLIWVDPVLNVGGFEIHDTVVREIGGSTFRVHLDGVCSNLQLRVPAGQWTVKGKLRWDLNTRTFSASWIDFNFGLNSGARADVDLGNCQGQPSLFQAIRESILKIAGDQAWMQDVLKQGVLDWVQTSLVSLHRELIWERQMKLSEKLNLVWTPSELYTLPGGILRIAGQLALSKVGSVVGADTLDRSYDAKILQESKETGFVLPQDTLQRILSYLFVNGELQYRTRSDSVASFQSLLKNRFLQLFVWPDLWGFHSATLFYFDLSTKNAPIVTSGRMLEEGGSAYDLSTWLIANQWAPSSQGKYLQYIDFTTPLNAELTAKVNNNILSLRVHTNQVRLQHAYRSEFATTRFVNPWLARSLIGSSVKDYLNSTVFEIAIPDWQLGQGMLMHMRDAQAWKQSFRIPLDAVGSP